MKSYYILFLLITALIFSSYDCDCGDPTSPEVETIEYRADLIYPGNEDRGASRTPIFIWDGQLEYDEDGSFEFTIELFPEDHSELWYISAGSDTIFQYPDTLAPETKYKWKVITEASGGREVKSFAHVFTTGTGFNNPPALIKYVYPWMYSQDIPLDAVLSWYSFDPDGGDLTYDLWYRREQDSDSILVTDLAVTEYSIPLDADTRYYWCVTPYDDHGGPANSWVAYFNTIKTLPPHDPSPADGAVDVPVDLILSWSCIDPDGDTLTYDVEMGRAGGSMSSIGTGLAQDELPVVGLSEGINYKWKVTAEDDDGHRTPGPIWTFTTVGASEDVFADLTLTRRQTYVSELTRIDMIWARFDEGYAPQYAIRPLQPEAASCGGYDLEWQDSRNRYYYENAHTLYFLDPGTEYTFSITGGGGVPALTESIEFPQCAPVITSPTAFDFVSMDGFEVVWSGYDDFPDCDRQVSITIIDIAGDSTGVYVTTDNDGSYTFSAGELSVIDPSLMDLQIVLVVENVMNIDAPGYDPRSWIRARTLTVQTVYSE